MSAARGSVRRRLLAILFAGLALVWLAAMAATVYKADHEIEEVFDAHLVQSAALLALRIGDEADEVDTEHAPVLHKYAKPLSFQVWKHGRTLLLHSADAPGSRFSASDKGFSTVTLDGRDWRVFSLWDAKREHLVQVRDALRKRRSVIVDIVAAMAKPLAIALPFFALLVWFAVGRALRPLARLSDEISRRDPAYLAPLEGEAPAEIAPLVARLNALLARVQSSLDGERRFTSDAAHELRTPLAALRAQLQVAQGVTDGAGRTHAIDQALRAVERATHLVEQLLTLARLEHGAWQAAAAAFDLRAMAAAVIGERAEAAIARNITLSLEAEAPALVHGFEGLAAIALGNLLDNAIRYSQRDTAVTVSIASDSRGYGLSVRDQGPGIPAADREAAQRRFTRLEGAAGEEGSGLGLSIVARVAQLHGTSLALGAGPGGRGLEATLRFAAA
ncbi:MAG: sensor histidine kinase N-terminal domain-containing protein [Betaproteobacteria bacterium]|nr:sensor histidine kinase N-terminal domain-containing protein [Betaproteobacteria bacterium]